MTAVPSPQFGRGSIARTPGLPNAVRTLVGVLQEACNEGAIAAFRQTNDVGKGEHFRIGNLKNL